MYGADTAYDKHLELDGMDTYITVGAQLRSDDVDTALWHAEDRSRLGDCFAAAGASAPTPNPCNHTEDRIRNIAGYAEANMHLIPHVHVLPGIRYEFFTWDVDDLNPATALDPATTTGGSSSRGMVLPKLSVEVEAGDHLNLFANAGQGLHSNDARAAVASGGTGSLARASGGEVGARTTLVPHVKLATDFWYLHLDSELVWNGDEGGTDASGATRRYGVDAEIQYAPTPWLHFDANVTAAHAAFVANHGNGNALALAPRLMGQGGVTLTHGSEFVSLRGRGIADRPGNDADTLTAKGYFIFDLIAGWTPIKSLSLNATINNVLNTKWREAQFADASRVTPTADIVEQMHYTPGIPLTATVTAAYTF